MKKSETFEGSFTPFECYLGNCWKNKMKVFFSETVSQSCAHMRSIDWRMYITGNFKVICMSLDANETLRGVQQIYLSHFSWSLKM